MLIEEAAAHFNFTPSCTSVWNSNQPSYILPNTVIALHVAEVGEVTHIYHRSDQDAILYCESTSKLEQISLQVWLGPFQTEVWIFLVIFFPLGSALAFKPLRLHMCNFKLHPFYILMRQTLDKFGRMELLISFAALILLTAYETFITGSVIVPPKPATSLKEFVQNGFKAVDVIVGNADNITSLIYAPMFNKSGILNEMNSSVIYEVWNGKRYAS